MKRPRIEPCRVGPDGRPGVLVRTPFDEAVIEQLKTIPTKDRRWWPEVGAWWVSAEQADLAEHFVRSRWDEVDVVGLDGGITTETKGGHRIRQESIFSDLGAGFPGPVDRKVPPGPDPGARVASPIGRGWHGRRTG